MSSDGVHFNEDGHVVVAREILKAWGVTSRDDLPDACCDLCSSGSKCCTTPG